MTKKIQNRVIDIGSNLVLSFNGVWGGCASGNDTAIWRFAPNRVLTSLVLVLVYLNCLCCSVGPKYTEDPRSTIVGLRYELVAFANGQSESVTGRTEPAEAYILMYGYESDLDTLPISEILQKKLKELAPRPTEMYVLAHIYGNQIEEYTEWDLGHDDNYHPLLWPMPFLIRGDPFKITARQREPHRVVMKIE